MNQYSIRIEDVCDFEIREGLTCLEVQNTDLFWRIIQGLTMSDTDILVRKDNNIVNVLKEVVMLGDMALPFSIREFYKKSVYVLLQKSMSEEQIEKLFRLDAQIKSIIDECIIDANLPFNLDFSWQLDKLLKSQDINVEDNKNTSPFDKIEDVIHVASLMSEQRLLIAINTNLYFDQNYCNKLHSKLLAEGLNVTYYN